MGKASQHKDESAQGDVTRYGAVIVGDEPAGLWLARRLFADQLLDSGPILWIRFRPTAPIAVPLHYGPRFSLSLGTPWSVEVRSRRHAIRWTPDVLARDFPKLPHLFGMRGPDAHEFQATPEENAAILSELQRHPALLDWAKAWGRVSFRARRVLPERLLAHWILSSELAWWDPAADLQKTVGPSLEVRSEAERPCVASYFGSSSRGGYRATLDGKSTIESRVWIMNAPEPQLWRFCAGDPRFCHAAGLEALGSLAGRPGSPSASLTGSLPLLAKVEASAIPEVASPMILWLDSDVVPEPEHETWPISIHRYGSDAVLRSEVILSEPFSVESGEARFREAAARFTQVFPFLRDRIRGYAPPFVGDCADDAVRTRWSERAEAAFTPRYEFSAFRRLRRDPAIEPLLPSYRCDLPYPTGPLLAAREALDRRAAARAARATTEASASQ